MSVIDGQPVDAATSNPSWISANEDDTGYGIVVLANADPASGAVIGNTQGLQNHLKNTTGATEVADGTTYSSNNVVNNGDNHLVALGKVDAKFNGTTGHSHNGVNGQGPLIPGANISSVPLHGYIAQGLDLSGVTGTSYDVSIAMSGKTASSGSTVKGVVVIAPMNKVLLRQASGSSSDDVWKDGSGNVVYGRLTYAVSVWTLSFYVDLSGVETAYNFTSSSNIRWYYQELFSSVVDAPVYSEFTAIPSDNMTSDVIAATTSAKGKTQLASVAPADIASSGSAGTANATVANADHTHKGVTSLSETGDTKLYGDVELEEGTNVTITRSGQKLNISTSASIGTVPSGIISAFGGTSAPSGWLLCDGTSYLIATYSTLAAVLFDSGNSKYAYGSADGSHFNVPDLRGRFVRGRDAGQGRDPDAGSRTTINTNGNSGDAVGSLQGHALYSHNHDDGTLAISASGAHGHTDSGHTHTQNIGNGTFGSGSYTVANATPNFCTTVGSSCNTDTGYAVISDTNTHPHANASFSGLTGSYGGLETRPVNVYVNYIIKT